jgi:hypothetical protein
MCTEAIQAVCQMIFLGTFFLSLWPSYVLKIVYACLCLCVCSYSEHFVFLCMTLPTIGPFHLIRRPIHWLESPVKSANHRYSNINAFFSSITVNYSFLLFHYTHKIPPNYKIAFKDNFTHGKW